MAAVVIAGGAPARAAEVTRVVSGFDKGRRIDINGSVSWLHEARSGFIKRESESAAAAQTELIKDLKYSQSRDVLNIRLDLGVFWDLGFHIDAPIVIRDARSLDFDQSAGSNCTYPGDPGARPTCVNAQNSTLLRDGILPGAGKTSYGLDATHDGRAFGNPSPTVFRGPNRSGLESLGLGLTWAAMNQARDDSKPTWTVGFDAKLDVAGTMRFNPASPGANTAVGLGYHQLVWSTFVSKRFDYFDPYFGAWFMQPVRTSGSPFQPSGSSGNQTSVNPQQRLGVIIGVEQIAWEVPAAFQSVTIEARAHGEHHLAGRARTPLWEPLSGSSRCTTADTTQCRPSLDFNNGKPDPYPGVTETQAYATLGGDIGLNVRVGKHVRFRGLFGLAIDLPHFITYAAAGVDKNNDGVVNVSQPGEANPVYRESIDLPGRRFRVDGTQIWSLFVDGAVLF